MAARNSAPRSPHHTAPTGARRTHSSIASMRVAPSGSGARVNVPAGAQTGHQFRLKHKGMSVLRSQSRGDLFIEAVVETPVNLNKKQQELLREFEKTINPKETSPQSAGFFSRVKEFWDDLRE